MKKNLFCIWLCLAVFNTVQSQELPEINLPQIAPPSPEAAILGKFINTPVSHFTGIPQIQIPIAQLQEGNISVPISLSYHSGGIRVDEMATRVGLGWKLNAGGSVTRMVRGLPDDAPDGYINTSVNVLTIYEDVEVLHSRLLDVLNGTQDLESDIYHFNLPDGTSGKFFFNQDGDIYTIPANSDAKIQYVQDNDNKIIQWIITSSNGISFYLGQSSDASRAAYEKTSSSVWATTNSAPGGPMSFPAPSAHLDNYITTWHLMQINDFTGNQVAIEYEPETTISFVSLGSQSKILPTWNNQGCASQPRQSYSYTEATSKIRRISSISSRTQRIDFIYDHDRLDLVNDKALTAITIQDNSDNNIKSIALGYDYFQAVHHSDIVYGNLDQRRKRLYLTHIIENPDIDDQSKTAFEYHTTNLLPDRLSYAQDFWGYYNGRHDNNSLIPTIEYQPTVFSLNDLKKGFVQNVGADRKVYEEYAKACSLKKVIYPTKGSTAYDLEANTVYESLQFFAATRYDQEVIVTRTTFNDPNEVIEIPFSINADDDAHVYPVGGIVDYQLRMYDHTGEQIAICNTNGFDCPQVTIDGLRITDRSGSLHFDEGSYTIRIDNYSASFGEKIDIEITLLGRRLLNPESPNATYGGLRVAAITQRDSDQEIITKKHYEYRDFSNPSLSSGKALHPPVFINFNAPVCEDRANPNGTFVYSRPIRPLDNESGFNVGYINVTEFFEGAQNGKTEYTFSWAALGTVEGTIHAYQYIETNSGGTDAILPAINSEEIPQAPHRDLGYTRGVLSKKVDYIREADHFNIVQEVNSQYDFDYNGDVASFQNVVSNKMGNYLFYRKYNNYSGAYLLKKNTTTSYYYDEAHTEEVITEKNYDYESYPNHYFPTVVNTTNSRAGNLITKTYYPDDSNLLAGLSDQERQAIEQLNKDNQHRIAMPIQTDIYSDTNADGMPDVAELLGRQRNLYKIWDDERVLLEKIQSNKKDDRLQDQILYQDYDDFGNPLEVAKVNGIPISYIWGYGHTRPIAKLEGISYEAIDPELISNLQVLSDSDNDEPSENALREALHSLRSAYPNATITTFTYDPLVGVTSITDPKGNTTFYSYDAFNRLEQVKDRDRDTLETLDYNYTQDEEPQH